MNEDYLWDKSGERDPEIEELEKALAPLRFERSDEILPLPAASRWTFGRGVSPSLAAAASLLILILGGGLWLGLKSSGPVGEQASGITGAPRELNASKGTTVNPDVAPLDADDETPASDIKAAGALVTDKNLKKRPQPAAPRRRVIRRSGPSESARQAQLASQGENAKAQLILALHIASDKLNAVQKMIQASPGS